MRLQTCGAFAGLAYSRAPREGPGGRIGPVENRLQSELYRVQIVQESKEKWSVGRFNIVNDHGASEIVAVLKPDVCTTQFAQIDGQVLVLTGRDEVLAFCDEAFAVLSV